jgi:hypothetical protein
MIRRVLLDTPTSLAPLEQAAPEAASAPLRARVSNELATQQSRSLWAAYGSHANLRQVARIAPNLAQAVRFDGMCIGYAPVFRAGKDRAIAPMFLLADGYVGANYDSVWTHGNGDQQVFDPYLGVWNSWLSAGASWGQYYNRAHALGTRVGLQGNGTVMGRSRTALNDPRLDPRDPLAPCQHTFHHEVKLNASLFGGLAGLNCLQGLTKLDVGRQVASSYTTTLPLQVSLALDDSGAVAPNPGWRILRWFYNLLASLRGRSPHAISSLSQIPSMLPGDRLSETAERSWGVVAPSPGGSLLYVGAQFGRFTQRRVSVDCLEDGKFRLQVDLQRARHWRGFGVIPGGLFAHGGKTTPRSVSHTFEFNDAASCSAWAQDFLTSKRSLDILLTTCPGTKLSTSEVHAGTLCGLELGVRFCLFSNEFWQELLPRGFSMGLLKQGEHGHLTIRDTQWDAPNEHAIVRHYQTYTANKVRFDGPAGRIDQSVRALLELENKADQQKGPPQQVRDLVLMTEFNASRISPAQLNQRIIRPLRKLFAQCPADFPPSDLRHSRSVSFRQRIPRQALLDWTPQQILQHTRPVNRRAAAGLAMAWHKAGSSELERAEALGVYIETWGQAGMAAICRLLHEATPEQAPSPVLTTHSDAYDRLTTEVVRLSRRYAAAPHPLADVVQDKGRLVRRLDEVEQALLEVEQTRQLLEQDPLLSQAARTSGIQLCGKATLNLQKLMDFDPTLGPVDQQQTDMRRAIRAAGYPSAMRQRLLHVFDHTGLHLHKKFESLGFSDRGVRPAQDHPHLKNHLRREARGRREYLAKDLLLAPQWRANQIRRLESVIDWLDGEAPASSDHVSEVDTDANRRRELKYRGVWRSRSQSNEFRQLEEQNGKADRRAASLLRGMETLTEVSHPQRLNRFKRRLHRQLAQAGRPIASPHRAAAQAMEAFDALMATAQKRDQTKRAALAAAVATERLRRHPAA